mmetsp:Transcript_491/g.1491  ORF Transcript_491/g.1491 Transcript_491/m.1491 type:complete len:267 (+) Transcript_491:338-1138(+)
MRISSAMLVLNGDWEMPRTTPFLMPTMGRRLFGLTHLACASSAAASPRPTEAMSIMDVAWCSSSGAGVGGSLDRGAGSYLAAPKTTLSARITFQRPRARAVEMARPSLPLMNCTQHVQTKKSAIPVYCMRPRSPSTEKSRRPASGPMAWPKRSADPAMPCITPCCMGTWEKSAEREGTARPYPTVMSTREQTNKGSPCATASIVIPSAVHSTPMYRVLPSCAKRTTARSSTPWTRMPRPPMSERETPTSSEPQPKVCLQKKAKEDL